MTIPLLNSIAGSQQQQSLKVAGQKVQAAIANLVGSDQATQATSDIANVSTASQLQAHTSGLRQISSNLTQALSLTQVADGSIEQIQDAISQLEFLASSAGSDGLTSQQRTALDGQFQQLLGKIDQIAGGASFNGAKLLDGSLSGDKGLSLDNLIVPGSASESDLSIPDLSSQSLLGSLSLLSPGDAQSSLGTLTGALTRLDNLRTSLGDFQQTLDFVAANIGSAISNQEAARATIQDGDLALASIGEAQAQMQRNADIALTAQTNHLSPALLQLVG